MRARQAHHHLHGHLRCPGRLDRLFAPFEGTRDPLPLAVMRVAFFAGLFLHFAPSLLWLDIGYGHGAVRADAWSHWLFSHLWRSRRPCSARWRCSRSAPASRASPAGPRIAAIVAFAGCYAFASFNSIHLQTLALIPAWAILILWAICGGDPRSRLLAGLVLFQVLLAVEFSGIEKLLAGWPWSNEMAVVLAYPRGFMVRDWVAALPMLHGPVASHLFTWVTLAVELGTPRAPARPPDSPRRARRLASCSSSASSRCSRCPPLFYCIFAGAPLLALGDDQIATGSPAGSGAESPDEQSSSSSWSSSGRACRHSSLWSRR